MSAIVDSGKAKRCILCESDGKSTLVQIGVRHAPETEVRRCSECGLVFLQPLPDENELDSYYDARYREEYGDSDLSERLRNDIDEARTRVQRLLPLDVSTRLLEIGSGSGAFLDAVWPYAGEITGVEPDAASRANIRKNITTNIYQSVDDVVRLGKTFDLVVMFHVLEHIPAPTSFLRGLAQLLAQDSKLVVEVPNVDDALVSEYQISAYLEFYYQKAHLYYFSADTLAEVFKQAGLNADIRGIQRYDLSNHIRWMLTGQPGGQGYYNDIFQPAVNAAYADSLIRAGRADTLWAVARKTD